MSRSDRAGPILAVLVLLLSACVAGVPGAASQTDRTQRTPGPDPTASAEPSATGSSTPGSSGDARPSASDAPTQAPTADPSVLDLEVTSCNGGVVLEWSPSSDSDFHHYSALRSPERDIAPYYPPIAPAVDWGDTYAEDRFVTSAADASIIPSDTTWFYRVMAYDRAGAVVGASEVESGRLGTVEALGQVTVTTDAQGRSTIGWRPYRGFSRCFSHYRVLYGTSWPPSTVLAVVSDQTAASQQTDALHAGSTYLLRVEAVRTTTLDSFVVGETETLTYTVP